MKIGKHIILIGVFVLTAVFLIAPNVTHAFTIWDVVGTIAGTFAEVIYVLGVAPLSYLLGATGYFVNALIEPAPVITASVVQIGWSMTRDFANSLFILILLGIALDFILFSSFQVKKMLPRLLLVALLINFSLPIAGIVLDFANVFTSFFLSKVSGGCLPGGDPCQFTQHIAGQLGLNTAFDGFSGEGFANVIDAGTESLRNVVFAIFFIAGTIFIFLALGLMFLIRTGYLYVLLVILPIVLVLWAFPPTGGYLGRWTHRFIQWTMFAPAATFFLYLSLLMFQGNAINDFRAATSGRAALETTQPASTATALVGLSASAQSTPGGSAPSVIQNFFQTIYMYITIWVLMLGSLFVAQAMGVKTAGSALKVFSQIGKSARGKLEDSGLRGLAAAGRKMKVAEGLEGVAQGLQKSPSLSALAGVVRGVGVKTKTAIEKREALTATEKAKYEGMSASMRELEASRLKNQTLTPGSGAELAYVNAIQAQKGELNVLNPDGTSDGVATVKKVVAAYENAQKYKVDKKTLDAIRYANPTAAQQINQNVWKKLEQEGKAVEVRRDEDVVKTVWNEADQREDTVLVSRGTGNIISGRNRETGESFEDTIKKITKVTTEQVENAVGTWTRESVKTQMEFGGIDSSFIRKASSAGDTGLLEHIADYLKDLKDLEKQEVLLMKLKKHNPEALNQLRSGAWFRYLAIKPEDINPKSPLLTKAGLKKLEGEEGFQEEEGGRNAGAGTPSPAP